MKNLYFIELTDMFGGEMNYSEVNRMVVRAKSVRGAANIVARATGLNFRYDGIKYISKSGATGMIIEHYETPYHSDYVFSRDARK